MDLGKSSMPRRKRTPDNGQPCLTPRCKEKKVEEKKVIQNTATCSNIIIENFYPILNVVAEVKELKCF